MGRRSTFGVLAVAFAAVASPAAPARAQPSDAESCANGTTTIIAIEACTRVIDRWGAANARIAWAFYQRGNALTLRRDYDGAIADYGIAIALQRAQYAS